MSKILEPYVAIVEQSIDKLGVSAQECRGEDNPYEWYLKKGFASVVAMLLEIDGYAYFEVFSEVMPVPTNVNREQFLEELLKINSRIIGTAFSLSKDGQSVQMNAIRECAGMDTEEAGAMIRRVVNNADEYGETFRQKYKYKKS